MWCVVSITLKDTSGVISYFLLVNKPHEKTKTNQPSDNASTNTLLTSLPLGPTSQATNKYSVIKKKTKKPPQNSEVTFLKQMLHERKKVLLLGTISRSAFFTRSALVGILGSRTAYAGRLIINNSGQSLEEIIKHPQCFRENVNCINKAHIKI